MTGGEAQVLRRSVSPHPNMEIYEWETFDWLPAGIHPERLPSLSQWQETNQDEESGGLPGG